MSSDFKNETVIRKASMEAINDNLLGQISPETG
jgi:hypothetical protein